MGTRRLTDAEHASAMATIDTMLSGVDILMDLAKSQQTPSERLLAYAKAQEASDEVERALVDIRNGKIPVIASPGMVLASSILEQVQPNAGLRAAHAGNWPAWAVAAVEYETHHRSFGNRSGGVSVKYFASEEEADTWISEEELHIRDIDYAYSMHGTRYVWDWGPQNTGAFHLG